MINEIELGQNSFFPERKEMSAQAAFLKSPKGNSFQGQLKRCSQNDVNTRKNVDARKNNDIKKNDIKKNDDTRKNDPNVLRQQTEDATRGTKEETKAAMETKLKDQGGSPDKAQVIENVSGAGNIEPPKEESFGQIAEELMPMPLQVENLSAISQVQAVTTLSSIETVPEQGVMKMQSVNPVQILTEANSLTGANALDEIFMLPVENVQVNIPQDKKGINESIVTILSTETASELKNANDLSSKKVQSKEPVQKPVLIQLSNESEPKAEVNDVKRIMQVESQRSINLITNATDKQLSVEKPETTEAAKPDHLSGQLLIDRMPTAVLKNEVVMSDLKSAPNQSAPSTQEVFDQIVKKVELFSKDNHSEMKIQLKPEFLGKMTIKLVVEDGLVTAKFFTESNQVKQILESNMNSLKQTLEASGLKVEKTEVNVQLSNGGQFGGDQQQSNLWQQYEQAGSTHYHRASVEDSYIMEDSYATEEIEEMMLSVEEGTAFSGRNELQGRFSIRI